MQGLIFETSTRLAGSTRLIAGQFSERVLAQAAAAQAGALQAASKLLSRLLARLLPQGCSPGCPPTCSTGRRPGQQKLGSPLTSLYVEVELFWSGRPGGFLAPQSEPSRSSAPQAAPQCCSPGVLLRLPPHRCKGPEIFSALSPKKKCQLSGPCFSKVVLLIVLSASNC